MSALSHPSSSRPVPASRLQVLRDEPPRLDADYVLYWMIGARRATWNFALDRAAAWCRELDRPLVVFESLDCDYQWASDRLHRFVIEGMRDNAAAFEAAGITYHPYVEPAAGAGRGLLAALAARAAVVVTDRAPVFRLPDVLHRGAARLAGRLEAVDGCGLLPLDAPPPAQVFPTAYAFRRYLQRELPLHLDAAPASTTPVGAPLTGGRVAATVRERWLTAGDGLRALGDLSALPIDHAVGPISQPGGPRAAAAALGVFVRQRLGGYAEGRTDLDTPATSGLSPYLHFGHISPHEVVHAVLASEGWTPARLATSATGSRAGWWGAAAGAEAFLDQVVTWRELGFNMSARRPDVTDFASLPAWALATLHKHASDPREAVYAFDDFDQARTHDELWNAAQRQLVREGTIHNYLRMLWGKKILEWSATPEQALKTMVALNDRYAVDGRDPNSYSGIGWVLGRYDRPWGPERPVYGTVRYMSSANTARKMDVKGYLRRHGAAGLF